MMLRAFSRLTPRTGGARFLCTAEPVLLVDVNEETAVATLTINRPKALNALNTEVGQDLKVRTARTPPRPRRARAHRPRLPF